MYSRKYLINNPYFKDFLEKNKIIIIDGGARGEIFKPFNEVNQDAFYHIRFEPDPEAEILKTSNGMIVPKALWRKSENININIAVEPSASSVYNFNRELQKQIDPHIESRKVKRIINVPGISLDDFFDINKIPYPDFIKLDVHGCEYDVLEGASKSLNNTMGLLIESWLMPIHESQKTHCHVECYLNNSDFYIFEQRSVGRWARKKEYFKKRQTVVIESLYFRNLSVKLKNTSNASAIKFLLLSDLFGHHGFTWQLADFFSEQNVISKEIENAVKNHLNKLRKNDIIISIYQRINGYLEKKITSF